jgi:hypothetical protein
LLSDAHIMKNIAEGDKGLKFSGRAFSARVGKARDDVAVTLLAGFWLPEITASDIVVVKMLEAIKKVKVKSDISVKCFLKM